MSSLDLDTLVAPIPGDDPAGSPVPYIVRAQLEDTRKGTESADALTDESASAARPVDWASMARLTGDILRTTSKDLLVAAQLTEAVTCRDGLPALAEGLELLRRLLDEAWDRLHPAIDDGDLEVRAAAFNWLAEPDRGARFPVTIRTIPLFEESQNKLSWLDWKRAQEGRGDVASDTLDRLIAKVSRQDAFRVVAAVRRASEQCESLVETLSRRLGDAAPSMQGLTEATHDCLELAEHLLARKGGPPTDDGADLADADTSAAAETEDAFRGGERKNSTADIQRAIMTRGDVYRRLADLADELRILEPHSPVPVLVRKAVAWGNLSFPELLRAMTEEEGLLSLLSKSEEQMGAMEEMLQEE